MTMSNGEGMHAGAALRTVAETAGLSAGMAGMAGMNGLAGMAGGEPVSSPEQNQTAARPTVLGDSVPAASGPMEAGPEGQTGAHGKEIAGSHEDSAAEGEALVDGVPDSPEGYAFSFAPGVVVDEQALEAFREVAFEQGIFQRQAAQVAQLYASLVERQQEDQRATLEETEAGWLKELKHSRNYAGMVASARLTMERFGTPELNALLNETRLGSHPALVRFVASIGRELGEPVFIQGKRNGRPGRLNFYETMES